MMRRQQQRQAGFTLIEITIVVLIAGLLIGAVLGGRAILDESRFIKVNKATDEAIGAFLAYRQRYGFMPGDDPNAAARWVVAGVVAGDGDGILDAAEFPQAVLQLRLSGFVDPESVKIDPAYPAPNLVFDIPHCSRGSFAEQTPAASGSGWDGRGNTAYTRRIVLVEDVPSEIARRLEEELDDSDFDDGPIQESADPFGAVATVDMYYSFRE